MKKKHLFCLLILLLFSCKKQEPNIAKNSQKVEDSIYETTVPEKVDSAKIKEQEAEEREWEVHKKEIDRIEKENQKNFIYNKLSNQYLLKLFCIEEENGIVNFKRIEIFQNNKLVQKLNVDSAYVFEKNQIGIDLKDDANFDGYKDLKLINWAGNHIQESFHFWIYDTNTNKFYFNKSLSKIVNPFFDIKRKEVISRYNFGPSSDTENEDVYVWKNETLVLDHGFQTSPVTGEALNYYRKNGKIVYKKRGQN